MVLLPFFEIPYGDRLAKNVKKQYVQVIPRSTSYVVDFIVLQNIKYYVLYCNSNKWDKTLL